MEKEIASVREYLLELQKSVADALLQEEESGAAWEKDEWDYDQGGGGCSYILEGGAVFERAGVNFSHVQGDALPAAATKDRQELTGAAFEALGVSLIIHPENPYAPTSHANVRLFVARPEGAGPVWWFGGGFDLTPCYGFEEDAVHWHQTAQKACDPFGDEIHSECKQWCDDYFFLKHRGHCRGVGGLFFDDWNRWEFERCFEFMRSVGNHYVPAYLPLIQKRKGQEYGEAQREWQLYRRGRYVEYNLVYDRGTTFGLQSGGRTESILMSMPPLVRWRYNYQPEPGTPEAELESYYLQPRDWLE